MSEDADRCIVFPLRMKRVDIRLMLSRDLQLELSSGPVEGRLLPFDLHVYYFDVPTEVS